ncbi:hypothetical protein SUGI_0040230 [Cryptomeria japonica]|nr:hypothetical protein SUGI_0040230 [Cryptomeria japonica]
MCRSLETKLLVSYILNSGSIEDCFYTGVFHAQEEKGGPCCRKSGEQQMKPVLAAGCPLRVAFSQLLHA